MMSLGLYNPYYCCCLNYVTSCFKRRYLDTMSFMLHCNTRIYSVSIWDIKKHCELFFLIQKHLLTFTHHLGKYN